MNNRTEYVLKIWLTALFLSPLIISIVAWHHLDGVLSLFLMVFFMVVLGMVFSIPSVVLLLIIMAIIQQFTNWSVIGSRLVWTLVAAGLCILPFMYLDHLIGSDMEVRSMGACYTAITIAGIWIYKFPRTDIEPGI
ncbi:hypothetical protein [Mucilaginibacter myungsuensis]|uniref:Uncharacterized protein n=1 Tax=Mucilaginibacter myungsuensis TaxID=649104 RepID=A0A929KX06_9SPHI|nr:hypothetical protein [Mucilaginibacter myungsuensis]MBE9662222.1 hypothetical protein [Mucilaginibacter myungsuensis]MDN3599344.1 hypothetical protein [Mucilaginibacter myungsuensis]